MAKRTKRVESSTALIFSDIPNIFGSQDHVFKTAEDLQYSLRGLVKILGRRHSGLRNRISSYLIEQFEVEFSTDYRHEHVYIDHARATIVIRVPKRRNEKPSILEIRRNQYLLRYTALTEEIRTRGLIQAYRALGHRGRSALIRRERKAQSQKRTTASRRKR